MGGAAVHLGDFRPQCAQGSFEGARAITGPTLGASATVAGFVTGSGEAAALVFRLLTGRISDRTGKHWALSVTGYAMTVIAVPLMALTQTLWPAAALVIAERFGKAVRTPARDTMLAQASSRTGRGTEADGLPGPDRLLAAARHAHAEERPRDPDFVHRRRPCATHRRRPRPRLVPAARPHRAGGGGLTLATGWGVSSRR
ncbi:MFS transporter [Streptomyces sp. NPDC047046]|uniref:MFS transporter n=1 Tax=Streptomyces sp. NPDC047046 TaxID=3155378 RepID=UPI0033DB603F